MKNDWEQVVLDNGRLRVVVLPELGAKIASLRALPRGEELLQAPLLPYGPRDQAMAFDAADASGFDECLPSVNACQLSTPAGPAQIPDHGDFWRIPFRVQRTGEKVRFEADGFSLPLSFAKTLWLDGDRLRIEYSVRNTGSQSCEYLWASHPLFVVEAGDRVELPPSVQSVLVTGSARERLRAGKSCTWPKTALEDGRVADLSLAGSPQEEIGDKLFAEGLRDGWCALHRGRLNTTIRVEFNLEECPALGLWLCYGGWPLERAARQQCVALEPCTAPFDSLADASRQGKAQRLAAGEAAAWSISIFVGTLHN